MEQLSEEVKKIRREYQREYYKKNKEKRKVYNNNYWVKKFNKENKREVNE